MNTNNKKFKNNKKVSNNVQGHKKTKLAKINNNSVLKFLRDNISVVSFCISGITIFIAVISYNYRLGEMDYWNISSENLSFSLEQNIYDVFQFVLIAILVFFVNLWGFLILKSEEESIGQKDGITFIDAEIIYIFTTINSVLWVYLNTRVMLQGIDMPPQNIRYYIFFVVINFVVNVASNILVNKSLAISKFKIDNSEGQRGTESELKQDNLKCKKLVFFIKFVLMIVYAHASLKIFECFNIKVFLIDVELVWGWIAIFFGFLHLPSITIYCIGYISVSNTNKTILEQLRDGSVLFLVPLLIIIIILIIFPYTFYSDGINQQKNKKEFLVIKEIDNTPMLKQIVLYEGKDFYIVSSYKLFNEDSQVTIIIDNEEQKQIKKENVTIRKKEFDNVYTENSFRKRNKRIIESRRAQARAIQKTAESQKEKEKMIQMYRDSMRDNWSYWNQIIPKLKEVFPSSSVSTDNK